MKYRSRTDIIAMILQGAMLGATKTRLMYGAYLSYAQIQEYVKFLQEKGLLAYEEGAQKYKLTEKGLHFLQLYDQISESVTLKNNRLPNQVASLPAIEEYKSVSP
jgi:predicted transcriptional regulator